MSATFYSLFFFFAFCIHPYTSCTPTTAALFQHNNTPCHRAQVARIGARSLLETSDKWCGDHNRTITGTQWTALLNLQMSGSYVQLLRWCCSISVQMSCNDLWNRCQSTCCAFTGLKVVLQNTRHLLHDFEHVKVYAFSICCVPIYIIVKVDISFMDLFNLGNHRIQKKLLISK